MSGKIAESDEKVPQESVAGTKPQKPAWAGLIKIHFYNESGRNKKNPAAPCKNWPCSAKFYDPWSLQQTPCLN